MVEAVRLEDFLVDSNRVAVIQVQRFWDEPVATGSTGQLVREAIADGYKWLLLDFSACRGFEDVINWILVTNAPLIANGGGIALSIPDYKTRQLVLALGVGDRLVIAPGIEECRAVLVSRSNRK